MFIKVKLFVKKNFRNFYDLLHNVLFPYYLSFYRNKKLKKFNGDYLYNFSYIGISFKIWLCRDNGFVDEEIFVNGVYEPEILEIYKEYLKSGDVYVDIGTNIGQHALFASRLVGDFGKIVCFEPIKSIFEQLRKSKDENNFKNMILYNKAIGSQNDKLKIYKNKKNMGASSIILRKGDFVEEVEVSDGEELNNLEKINFIKIDTEGYENIVIRSIKKYIEKFKPILLIEYTPKLYGEKIEDKIEILDILKKLNYRIFDLENNRQEIKDINDWFLNFQKEQTNILCVVK